GLSQDRARRPRRTGDHAVRVPDEKGPDSRRMVRRPGRPGRPRHRRYRHAVGPDRANPHLDLRRQPPGLAVRPRPLAGDHASGRLDGFTFAPDAAEAGSDAKALQAAAQQLLASEIDARATKLSAAPDDQFVLTSDGTIRWTGDAVAKLVAADDALHPRIRII